MKLIKLAAAVLNQTPLDWDGNARNIRAAIAAAREQCVSVLCLPELCITGYGCEDAFYSAGVVTTALDVLCELVAETEGLIVSLGLPISYRGGLFSCACLAVNGQVAGFVGKQNLAGEGLHYEPRWFKPWPNNVLGELQVGAETFPLGDLMFSCGGVRVGFEICEDAWVLNRPGGELAVQEVDILLNPSASHFAFDKHDIRQRFVLDGARVFCTSYVYANLLGNEAGRAIYDGDAMIASQGQLLKTGERFQFAHQALTTAVVDIDATRMSRQRSSSFPVEVRARSSNCVSLNFDFPGARHEPLSATAAAWQNSDSIKEEEFTRAIALGLFDYLRKSRAHGFVISLSGGADSAAVAVLVAKMVDLAVAQLGLEGVHERLAYIPGIRACRSAQALVASLLTCAYQATRNSSDTTRTAAREVALGLGATFYELEVDALVDDYVALISKAIRRPLTWDRDDLALQNIQARARGPSVWLLANLHNALLLATSNRSEAAVGYATMDGDTCGGLSPIAGIDKAFLRKWLKWIQLEGPAGIGPFPALAAVTQQQPTAELRPLSSKQTDEADLMPYELLDAIERAAIRDKLTPLECLQRMEQTFQYPRGQLADWVVRFFQLWCRNQWKRERYAPSFHVDDENLDPKTWCRFPILSGGYQRELRLLRQYVAQKSAL